MLEEHVRHCVASALQSGDENTREQTLSELSDLLARFGGTR